jgi:hypothetical protein
LWRFDTIALARKVLRRHFREEETVKARRLIEASTFEPETLQVVCKAFDEAWAEISHHFAADESEIEQARMRLAHAVLIVAREDSNVPGRVKNDALQVMALAYRERG